MIIPEMAPELPCPTCGQPVESWKHIPGYILTADDDGITERRVRVVGANGPEWTLHPCGDQFYTLKFQAQAGPPPDLSMVITKILTEDNDGKGWETLDAPPQTVRFVGGPLDGGEGHQP